MRAMGFRDVRVRHHGDVARIELGPEEIGRALDPTVRARAAAGPGCPASLPAGPQGTDT